MLAKGIRSANGVALMLYGEVKRNGTKRCIYWQSTNKLNAIDHWVCCAERRTLASRMFACICGFSVCQIDRRSIGMMAINSVIVSALHLIKCELAGLGSCAHCVYDFIKFAAETVNKIVNDMHGAGVARTKFKGGSLLCEAFTSWYDK